MRYCLVLLACVIAVSAHGQSLLVFSKTAGFRHGSIPDAIAAIQEIGIAEGYTVDTTEDAQEFTLANLSNYDAVVFALTSGDVLNASQQAAFEGYIQAGGGYVGIHSASDTEYTWPWYGLLVGAYFDNHPAQQNATVLIENGTHPATAGIASPWSRFDEWYNFQSNPRPSVNVLATLDESSYSGGDMGADHPIAWYHQFDGGRSFYTGMGHTSASYTEADFVAHIAGGIRYAMGLSSGGKLRVDASGQWFEKADSGEPVFMSGVGGPEGFLFETDARKQEIVDNLIASDTNALYFHSLRSFEGDGHSFEDPFVVHEDPTSAIDTAVLDNWRFYLDQLDSRGIISWFHIIDDTARPWGCDVPLSAHATRYISTIVNRFKDLDNLVWLSGEEFLMGSCTAAEDRALMSAIAAEIRLHDPIHPIGVHHNNGQAMQFGDDPNINVFAQQICGNSAVRNPQGIHDSAERGDWVYVMSECHPWHLDLLHDDNRQMIRLSNWATAMAGGYVMLYNAYECAHAGRLCSLDSNENPIAGDDPHDPSADILEDLTRLRDFMESSRFSELQPADERATQDTLWALANDTQGAWIAYASDSPTTMGLSGVDGFAVTLQWFDPATGASVNQSVMASSGGFAVPGGLGQEVAVFIERDGPPVPAAPVAVDDTYAVAVNSQLNVDAAFGVLNNDSDANGDNLTAILESVPDDGTLLLNADGSFTYTPSADFSGTDGFVYRASDGALISNLATVSLTVTNDSVLLSLVDADADAIIQPMVNGAELVAADLAFSNYSVATSQVPAKTESIVFVLSGQQAHQQVENVAPFALFGDTGGDYAGMPLEEGSYMLAVSAFDGADGGGNETGSTLLEFTVVENAKPEVVFMNGFEQ